MTKDSNAFIVVYSISDKASFVIAVDTIKNVRLGGGENKSHPIILVGNKSDLVRKRSISREGNDWILFLWNYFSIQKV